MTATINPHPGLKRRRILWFGIFILFTAAFFLLRHKQGRLKLLRLKLQIALQSRIADHFARSDRRNAFIVEHLLSNFGNLDRYAQANHHLPPATASRVVFYGDSITDFWPGKDTNRFFLDHHYIDRGVMGQATPELLWRFRQDVLDLHPGTVVLLGGTNDILQQQDRHLSLYETERNLQSMVEAAQRQHIRVILCLLTPIYTRLAVKTGRTRNRTC